MKVFSNILDNAFEATIKVEPDQRYIKMNTTNVGQWLLIQVENSFKQKIAKFTKNPKTVKKDSILHGHGFRIIREIIEAHGGIIKFEADNENGIFKFQVLIPRKN